MIDAQGKRAKRLSKRSSDLLEFGGPSDLIGHNFDHPHDLSPLFDACRGFCSVAHLSE